MFVHGIDLFRTAAAPPNKLWRTFLTSFPNNAIDRITIDNEQEERPLKVVLRTLSAVFPHGHGISFVILGYNWSPPMCARKSSLLLIDRLKVTIIGDIEMET